YPQSAYPYLDLIQTNQRRGRHEQEYELLDTGIFAQDRYFDVFVEYAKGSPEDILIRISVHNRGPEAAEIHLLPTLWFADRWSWAGETSKPVLRQVEAASGCSAISVQHARLGQLYLHCEGTPPLLFTENETNNQRLFGKPNESPFVKDGINDFVVH